MTTTAQHQLLIEPTFDSWREHARLLLANRIAPEDVLLIDRDTSNNQPLFEPAPLHLPLQTSKTLFVPKAFIDRASIVACHRAPNRWQLLYRLLWRLQTDRTLLALRTDDDVAALGQLEHHVLYDRHKMHAFVRFRKVTDDEGDHYIAWHRPEHRILRLAAPFFVERFAAMRWTILTPDESASWSPATQQLTFHPGVPREAAPEADDLESLWKTYYRSIFNPARLNPTVMRSHMPVRYWKTLPELDALPELLTQATSRVETMMITKTSAAPFVPDSHALPVLREAVQRCQGCDLYKYATHAVFGAGPAKAKIMMIGEQPGNEEDHRGEPFVGPAGRLLDTVLEELAIDRTTVYVTNAVKHFKFIQRGKLRLHKSPSMGEMTACKPWLKAELDAVRPRLVVCLGATAAKSVLGAKFALMQDHGKLLHTDLAENVIATLHPSAILRAPDPERGAEMRHMLRNDLALAAKFIA